MPEQDVFINFIDDLTEVPEVETVMSEEDSIIAATDGITLIKGKSGSGKSYFVFNMVKRIFLDSMMGSSIGFDFPTSNIKVGYFSTEMSIQQLKKRYNFVVEDNEELRERFKLIDLRTSSGASDYFNIVQFVTEDLCLDVVIIDQIADFVSDINSSMESNMYVNGLLEFCIRNKVCLICVMHQNEDSNNSSKARGHLGSSLEQKAIASISISKNYKGQFIVKSTKVRDGVPFKKTLAMENNLMKVVDMESGDRLIDKINFPINATDLDKRIMELTGKSRTYAIKIKNGFLKEGLIKKEKKGLNVEYHLNYDQKDE